MDAPEKINDYRVEMVSGTSSCYLASIERKDDYSSALGVTRLGMSTRIIRLAAIVFLSLFIGLLEQFIFATQQHITFASTLTTSPLSAVLGLGQGL
jgi:hypothetical protein